MWGGKADDKIQRLYCQVKVHIIVYKQVLTLPASKVIWKVQGKWINTANVTQFGIFIKYLAIWIVLTLKSKMVCAHYVGKTGSKGTEVTEDTESLSQ